MQEFLRLRNYYYHISAVSLTFFKVLPIIKEMKRTVSTIKTSNLLFGLKLKDIIFSLLF